MGGSLPSPTCSFPSDGRFSCASFPSIFTGHGCALVKYHEVVGKKLKKSIFVFSDFDEQPTLPDILVSVPNAIPLTPVNDKKPGPLNLFFVGTDAVLVKCGKAASGDSGQPRKVQAVIPILAMSSNTSGKGWRLGDTSQTLQA